MMMEEREPDEIEALLPWHAAGTLSRDDAARVEAAQAGAPGSYALVGFVPQASAADVTKFLETHKASVVDGPRAGGLYRIRIGEGGLSRDELAKIIDRIQQEGAVIRFAAPAD